MNWTAEIESFCRHHSTQSNPPQKKKEERNRLQDDPRPSCSTLDKFRLGKTDKLQLKANTIFGNNFYDKIKMGDGGEMGEEIKKKSCLLQNTAFF